jgi:hypothetical protein
MHNIPVTVLDNFFDDPDAVRELALQQKFDVDATGNWPGKRTRAIHEISPKLHNLICTRLFALFYDYQSENINWAVDTRFQKVDSSYKEGWVHTDSNTAVLSAIIYLTPNANIQGGTSIYRIKKENSFIDVTNRDEKIANYKGKMSNEDVEKYRLENNNQFEETIRVGNVYNRLVAFDAHMFHAAQNFFGDADQDNERLTLVLFTNSLTAGRSPVFRLRKCV